jgi:hypothetical protein
MNESGKEKLRVQLRAFFEAIMEEADANLGFARKLAHALAGEGTEDAAADTAPQSGKKNKPAIAKPVSPAPPPASQSFDPLELHLEAALISGQEAEARAFLERLDRAQLEEVVKAQRLPGGKNLQRLIREATDSACAVNAIVDSAAERVRSRYSAAS